MDPHPAATALQPAMLADIRRQADVLERLVARAPEFLRLGAERLRPGTGGRVFAFGCGDGWFAARAVAGVAREVFGLDLLAETSLAMLLREAPRASAADRAVAISMSGTVDRTNAAGAALTAAGPGYVALSNTDGAALGAGATAVASLEVPDVAAFLTGTARYSATVLGLMMLVEGAAGRTGAPLTTGSELRALIARLPAVLDAADAVLGPMARELVDVGFGGIRVLGAGSDWATADYGAAKLVKVVSAPVWSGEIEEYAHSQFWSSRADELVVLLASTPAVAQLAENTAAALKTAGQRVLAIETAGVPVPSATYRLGLPVTPDWLSPLLMPAPLQMLAYAMALATGHDPNRSQDEADPQRFLAAQLLSRRCELAA
jgi:fructoselysine-6-P-deglycase FrlB-like protein